MVPGILETSPITNGHGVAADVSPSLKSAQKVTAQTASDELILATIRCLAADLVQAYKGGHAGTAMGAAAIGVALFRDAMQYNPHDPLWFNRDRFVLSAGHACLFQYVMLHLVGYKAWTLDEIKRYHSRDFKTSKAAGHPEIEQDIGIEVTTGPLGQGIANAVGMAIASKQLAATYNNQSHDLVNNTIWCFTGDGCIQEGIGQEAISVAGHLSLDNLVLIYDCNSITVDGTIDNCFTEDVALRFQAAGWNVIDAGRPETLPTATEEISAVSKALLAAKAHEGAPTLVIVKTTIGFGSRKANTGPAHGQALGDEEVSYVKSKFGLDPTAKFIVPPSVYSAFSQVATKGSSAQASWNDVVSSFSKSSPEEYKEWSRRLEGRMPDGWKDLLPSKEELPKAAQPTRKSSGIVVEALAPRLKEFVAGSADLLESTFVSWKGMKEFQKPSSGLGDYSGRQLRYGIREVCFQFHPFAHFPAFRGLGTDFATPPQQHSMAAISTGLVAYFPQSTAGTAGLISVTSTFFMFTLYMAPALRMAALQKIRTITIATHDSIGIGEDGPTHQPIALASFFRALPGMRLWRPADAEETLGCWTEALSTGFGPSVLCLSRQPVALLEGSDRNKVGLGAYVVFDSAKETPPDLTLIATGSEVERALSVAQQLLSTNNSVKIRVVSMPCQTLFDAQPHSYRQSVLAPTSLIIAIEAWSSYGWAKYAHASCSMTGFGHSGPQADLYEMFGFGVENLVGIVEEYMGRWKTAGRLPGVGEFEELLIEHE